MKFFLALLLPLICGACATPKAAEKGEKDQDRLAREARENFLATKNVERKQKPRPTAVASAPLRSLRQKPEQPMTEPFFQERTRWFGLLGKPRRNEETVYEAPAQRGGELNFNRLRAAEARYARELAKSREDLTSEELLWARTRYY